MLVQDPQILSKHDQPILKGPPLKIVNLYINRGPSSGNGILIIKNSETCQKPPRPEHTVYSNCFEN